MFKTPVNTALCKDEVGSICCVGDVSETTDTRMADTDTTQATGTGSDGAPFQIHVKISDDVDNILVVDDGGLFVPSAAVVDARNGLSVDDNHVELGGTLIKTSTINGAGFSLIYEGGKLFARTAPTSNAIRQEITMDSAGWLVLQNLTATQVGQVNVNNGYVSLVSTTSSDGISLKLTATGIDIIHDTIGGPVIVGHIYLDGRQRGANAVNGDEFITKQQANSIVAPVIATATNSTYFTNANMNSDYPVATYPIGICVVFSNLTDAPSNTAELRRISNTEWTINLIANKLS